MKTTVSMTADEWMKKAPLLSVTPEDGLMAHLFIAGDKKIKATFEVED